MSDRVSSKAARLQQIERRLYNTPGGLRATDLASALGVDRRTIYRDLLTLEDAGVPVWQHDGRYGIDRATYLSTIRLNLSEAVALFFAARLLAHHLDDHDPHVVAALGKLAAGLPDLTISDHITRVANLISARPRREVFAGVLETVTRAWADRRAVKIRYRASNGDETERIIHPYVLEVTRREPGIYVLAYDVLRNARRTFKIERIVAAEPLNAGYSIPEDFDPYAQLSSAWGVMDEAEVDIQLRFSPAVASRVAETVWHQSQQLSSTPDGGCELWLRVGGIREVRAWILSWGADVEVLVPDALRAEITEHARRIVARDRAATAETQADPPLSHRGGR
jgi:predicted DNA-binding transcriptional regulator YafY